MGLVRNTIHFNKQQSNSSVHVSRTGQSAPCELRHGLAGTETTRVVTVKGHQGGPGHQEGPQHTRHTSQEPSFIHLSGKHSQGTHLQDNPCVHPVTRLTWQESMCILALGSTCLVSIWEQDIATPFYLLPGLRRLTFLSEKPRVT